MVIYTTMASILFSQVKFIAHRGASYLAPENTLAAAKLGWELGADAVEIDIHLSVDEKVMVIHDKTTKRTCGEDFTIKSTHSVQLRKLDAGSWKDEKYKGEKIPFLSEIVEAIPKGKKLVVEIKCGSEVIPSLKKVIDESGKEEQIVFIGFGWETMLDTKKAFPDNQCYWLSYLKPGLKKKMKQAAEIGLEGVNLRYGIIDKKVMKLANDLNLEVLAWTVDDPPEANRLIELGVAQITTNRPKWLKEEIEKFNKQL